jgi:hypothetical protein
VRISVSAVAIALATAALVITAACGGGDDGGSNDDGGAGSQTPFIAPSPYATDIALQKLDEAEQLVKLPDLELARKYDISTAELEQRIILILQGTSNTTGLDDARAALQEENRILAAEYIHNTVIDHVTPSFGSEDSTSISEEQLNDIDPGRVFVQDHSQGLLTTAVFKEAAVALIELWYRVLPG